jgi:hypothetical protein
MQVFSICGGGLLASIANAGKGLSKNFCHIGSQATHLSDCITRKDRSTLDAHKGAAVSTPSQVFAPISCIFT